MNSSHRILHSFFVVFFFVLPGLMWCIDPSQNTAEGGETPEFWSELGGKRPYFSGKHSLNMRRLSVVVEEGTFLTLSCMQVGVEEADENEGFIVYRSTNLPR